MCMSYVLVYFVVCAYVCLFHVYGYVCGICMFYVRVVCISCVWCMCFMYVCVACVYVVCIYAVCVVRFWCVSAVCVYNSFPFSKTNILLLLSLSTDITSKGFLIFNIHYMFPTISPTQVQSLIATLLSKDFLK